MTPIRILFTWRRSGEGPDLHLEGELTGEFQRVPAIGETVILPVGSVEYFEDGGVYVKIMDVTWEATGKAVLLGEPVSEDQHDVTLDQVINAGFAITDPVPREGWGEQEAS